MIMKAIGAGLIGVFGGFATAYYVYPMVVKEKPKQVTDQDIRNAGYIKPEECPK